MGSLVTSIFGGGMSTPKTPDPAPMPERPGTDPVAASVRDAERRKLRARNGGLNATLLTSPLGVTGSGSSSGPGGLLGRSG